jgi:hypothetical protein
MRFQFHHSCCDGVGAYRFLEDLLCLYDEADGGVCTGERLRPVDARLLKERTRLGRTRLGTLARLPQEIWGLVVGLLTFFARRPGPLAAVAEPAADEAHGLKLLDYPAHTFQPHESQALRQAARRWRCTLNDVLLRDLIVALDAWNAGHHRRRRRVRIMIPANVRDDSHDALPACNVVGMAFIDRRPWWYRTERWLLTSIRLETAFIKRFRLSLSFLRAIRFFELLPAGVKLLTRARWCYATSVLSNMGWVFAEAPLRRREDMIQAGGLVLTGVESAPPVRPKTSTSFTCLSYAGRLCLIMNYDRRHFRACDAAALFESVVARMRQTCCEAPSPGALEDRGDPLPQPDAHGSQPQPGMPVQHGVDERRCDAGAAGA